MKTEQQMKRRIDQLIAGKWSSKTSEDFLAGYVSALEWVIYKNDDDAEDEL